MRDEDLNAMFFHPLAFNLHPFLFRAGGIRTHDLLNPIQAHYQAVLRPDDAATIHSERGIANELFPAVIPSEVEGSRDVTLSPLSRDPSTPLRSAQDDRCGDPRAWG